MELGWTRTTIAGVPADVLDPPGRRGAVLYLHPRGGELGCDWPALAAALTDHRLACVAPHGGRSWWVGDAERHLVEQVVPWARATWGVAKLAAVGVSMGGQGAVRLGFRRPDLFPVVGSIAGAFDFHDRHGRGTEIDDLYESAERARQDTAILHLTPQAAPPHVWLACDPTDAEWWRGNDRLHEKLTAYGLPHVCDLDTEAGGHTFAYFDRMIGPLVAGAATALAAEGRRLV
jgi:S-formylglutathione hydrolase